MDISHGLSKSYTYSLYYKRIMHPMYQKAETIYFNWILFGCKILFRSNFRKDYLLLHVLYEAKWLVNNLLNFFRYLLIQIYKYFSIWGRNNPAELMYRNGSKHQQWCLFCISFEYIVQVYRFDSYLILGYSHAWNKYLGEPHKKNIQT